MSKDNSKELDTYVRLGMAGVTLISGASCLAGVHLIAIAAAWATGSDYPTCFFWSAHSGVLVTSLALGSFLGRKVCESVKATE